MKAGTVKMDLNNKDKIFVSSEDDFVTKIDFQKGDGNQLIMTTNPDNIITLKYSNSNRQTLEYTSEGGNFVIPYLEPDSDGKLNPANV